MRYCVGAGKSPQGSRRVRSQIISTGDGRWLIRSRGVWPSMYWAGVAAALIICAVYERVTANRSEPWTLAAVFCGAALGLLLCSARCLFVGDDIEVDETAGRYYWLTRSLLRTVRKEGPISDLQIVGCGATNGGSMGFRRYAAVLIAVLPGRSLSMPLAIDMRSEEIEKYLQVLPEPFSAMVTRDSELFFVPQLLPIW